MAANDGSKKNNDNLTLEIRPIQVRERHTTVGIPDGDWIIYRCEQCDYEFRDNWVTGEFVIRNAKADINHSGSRIPIEYCRAFTDTN